MRPTPLLIAALALAAPLAGCAPRRSALEVTQAAALSFSDSGQAREALGRRMRVLLLHDQFDRLDQIADSLRRSRERWPDDTWTLRRFYRDTFLGERSRDEEQWKELVKHVRVWRETRPRSITAPVALATSLVGYAWSARGTGSADRVTREGARLMRERLDEARMVLMAARRLPQVCPYWWSAAQSVALGQGWEREEYERTFEEAVARHPDFEGYYTAKAYFLLPCWYGKPGEWEVFATEIASRLPDTLAARVYAHIVWGQSEFYGNIFDETPASWERTKRGFRIMRAACPGSLEILSRFAYFACCALDRETAHGLFEALGDRVDLAVWRDARQFLRARAWALAPPG